MIGSPIATIELHHVALPTRREHKWTGLSEPIGGYVLIGLGWLVADGGPTRPVGLLWLAAAAVLGTAYWRGVVMHYPDSAD